MIILKIEEKEFESITAKTNISESTNVFTENQDTPQLTDDSIRDVRNWIKSTRHKRRKMRAEIQKHLSQSNELLNKFGLFKNVEICDSKLQKYNNTLKITSSKLMPSFTKWFLSMTKTSQKSLFLNLTDLFMFL
jgi:uncharacterized coiled-coil DUF342 family protein